MKLQPRPMGRAIPGLPTRLPGKARDDASPVGEIAAEGCCPTRKFRYNGVTGVSYTKHTINRGAGTRRVHRDAHPAPRIIRHPASGIRSCGLDLLHLSRVT